MKLWTKVLLIIGLVVANMLLGVVALKETNTTVAELPTLDVLPTETLTLTPTATSTPTSSATPTSTFTPTETVTPSSTPVALSAMMLTSTIIAQTPPSPTVPTWTPVPVTIRIKGQEGTQARGGPGISYDVVAEAVFRSVYTVHAQAEDFFGYIWYLVDLPGDKSGWILAPAAEVVSGVDYVTQVAIAQTIPPTPTLAPTVTLTPSSGLESALQEIPVFSGIGPNLKVIYLKGQQLGNHANVFAKVGDCNTKSDAFLDPIDLGRYKLGRYATLKKVINNFKGSFGRDSIAAQVGFNVASTQDTFWADAKYCRGDESPLDCEYRVTQPSIAFIMFGANDVLSFAPETYRIYMGRMIEKSLNNGIIPVLMTFTWHDHGVLYPKMLALNMVNVSLSQQYQIPLINFWLASQYLPGHGIISDNAHLSWSANGLDFTGEQRLWGQTLRSLLALEMLEEIEQQVGA